VVKGDIEPQLKKIGCPRARYASWQPDGSGAVAGAGPSFTLECPPDPRRGAEGSPVRTVLLQLEFLGPLLVGGARPAVVGHRRKRFHSPPSAAHDSKQQLRRSSHVNAIGAQ